METTMRTANIDAQGPGIADRSKGTAQATCANSEAVHPFLREGLLSWAETPERLGDTGEVGGVKPGPLGQTRARRVSHPDKSAASQWPVVTFHHAMPAPAFDNYSSSSS
jgi:hypothetical protein